MNYPIDLEDSDIYTTEFVPGRIYRCVKSLPSSAAFTENKGYLCIEHENGPVLINNHLGHTFANNCLSKFIEA